MNNLKIGIIIPDRGDRPGLLNNCLRMMKAQTKQPDQIILVDFPPENDDCDITKRYRIGYKKSKQFDLDAVLLIENDDYYHPRYIERMCEFWVDNDKPELLGLNYTIYYHIKLKRWLRFDHHNRASAMNTLIKSNLNFSWCPDHERYTDIWIWHKCPEIKSRKIIDPLAVLCIGIKHGIGKSGGEFHTTYLNRFKNIDSKMDYLKNHMDPESFDFYSNKENFKL